MIRAGIIGGAGYTGGELIRLLLRHPECNISYIYSRSQAGRKIEEIHTDLLGDTELKFSNSLSWEIDLLYLCLEHGKSAQFITDHEIPDSIKIIDLSRDFRLSSRETRQFCYGLPELNREDIRTADNIANPGCFAAALQLGIMPLARNKLLNGDLHISGITGATGAGRNPSDTTHFSWRSSNISLYKAFEHQHLKEVNKSIFQLHEQWKGSIRFLPFRGSFSRGILAALYTKSDASLEKIKKLYLDYYRPHPFVFLSDKNPDVKMAVNTNKCLLHLEKHEDTLLIVSVIDNLIKGASGQAVQNMNLMFGLNEKAGLELKASVF